MDLSRRNYPAAQRRLRELPRNIPQLDVCRLHAAAGRRDQAEVQALQKGLNTRSVSLDMATRAVLDLIVKAYCLKGGVVLSEPDLQMHRRLVDAEIEMIQAAYALVASSFLFSHRFG